MGGMRILFDNGLELRKRLVYTLAMCGLDGVSQNRFELHHQQTCVGRVEIETKETGDPCRAARAASLGYSSDYYRSY
jgi:hypothetical protein